MGYDFPGNVRELENIIERGVALESSNIILPESLILSLHKKNKNFTEETNEALFTAAHSEQELFERGMEEVLIDVEKKMIKYALEKSGNSKMGAADLLRISFRSLRYKVKKYGIG